MLDATLVQKLLTALANIKAENRIFREAYHLNSRTLPAARHRKAPHEKYARVCALNSFARNSCVIALVLV